jgi:hypothetical protein
MAVSCSPVSVAAKLAVVAQPRVGAFDDPSEPESKWLLDQARLSPLGAPLNPESNLGPHNDRWMVTYPRGPLG